LYSGLFLSDNTASGESLPIEPMASSPAVAIGASRNLTSSCVKPKACCRSSRLSAKASGLPTTSIESSLMRTFSIHWR